MIWIIIFAVIVFAVYAAAENLYILRVRHEKLGNGIRIVHLSDLHKRRFGEDNRLSEKIFIKNKIKNHVGIRNSTNILSI